MLAWRYSRPPAVPAMPRLSPLRAPILMGIILEFLRPVSPDRAPDVADAVADALRCCGGRLGWLCCLAFSRRPDGGG